MPPKANGTKEENIFKAIKSKNIKLVEKILKKKSFDANVHDPTDPLQRPALLLSCLEYCYEIVYLLLHNKYSPANVNGECLQGIRPIWIGIETGNTELVKLLLSTRRCDVNYIDHNSECSPLFQAIVRNNSEVVKLLIEGGADVNVVFYKYQPTGETPLIRAIKADNVEVCEMLINSLCNINLKTADGLTALHFAVSYSRYDICELLLQNNIKLHAATKHGATAMTVALHQNKPSMIRLLVRYGYQVNKMFRYMQKPLEHAIYVHNENCALMLVKEGCSIRRKRDLDSYFKLATNEAMFRLMKLLVDVYPVFLKEKWIIQNQWPVSIYRKLPILEWLSTQSSNTRSLRALCRSRIFRLLGKCPETKIKHLKLPDKIEDYILMKEHEVKDESEDYIFSNDCPYDCSSSCSKRYCPLIDISDSDDDVDDY